MFTYFIKMKPIIAAVQQPIRNRVNSQKKILPAILLFRFSRFDLRLFCRSTGDTPFSKNFRTCRLYSPARTYKHIVLHNTYIVPPSVNFKNVTLHPKTVLILHTFTHFNHTIHHLKDQLLNFFTSSALANRLLFM